MSYVNLIHVERISFSVPHTNIHGQPACPLIGSFQNKNYPHRIKAFKESPIAVRQVCCSAYGTAALSFDGKVYTWGVGEMLGIGVFIGDGDSPNPKLVKSLLTTRIKYISCGAYFILALSFNGRVFSWGRNEEGALGIALNKTRRLTPGEVSTSNFLGIDDPAVAIATGMRHGALLSAKGFVLTWGGDVFGPAASSRDFSPILKLSFDDTTKGSSSNSASEKNNKKKLK